MTAPYPDASHLRDALQESLDWHERHHKALSKQPPRGDLDWRRLEHRSEIERITFVLKHLDSLGPVRLVRMPVVVPETDSKERRDRVLMDELAAELGTKTLPETFRAALALARAAVRDVQEGVFDKPLPRPPIQEMSGPDLYHEMDRLEQQWRDLRDSLEDSGGSAGSPGESIIEALDEVEAEMQRRRMPIPPPMEK